MFFNKTKYIVYKVVAVSKRGGNFGRTKISLCSVHLYQTTLMYATHSCIDLTMRGHKPVIFPLNDFFSVRSRTAQLKQQSASLRRAH